MVGRLVGRDFRNVCSVHDNSIYIIHVFALNTWKGRTMVGLELQHHTLLIMQLCASSPMAGESWKANAFRVLDVLARGVATMHHDAMRQNDRATKAWCNPGFRTRLERNLAR